jgi:hypothetical protein
MDLCGEEPARSTDSSLAPLDLETHGSVLCASVLGSAVVTFSGVLPGCVDQASSASIVLKPEMQAYPIARANG